MHVQDVARRLGLSYGVVDQILKAYIEDLRDTLKAGTSVKLERLVTIHVKANEEGTGYKTSSAVSKPLRNELSTIVDKRAQQVRESDEVVL